MIKELKGIFIWHLWQKTKTAGAALLILGASTCVVWTLVKLFI